MKAKSCSGQDGMRWGIERRMEFIEFLLYWEGRVNRRDITDYFGISTPQASADLSRYAELAPGNMEYNRSVKCYLASADFTTALMAPNADKYLSQLLTSKEQNAALFYGQGMDFATVPRFQRLVDNEILRCILQAIRNRKALQVEYQSLRDDESKWRWITPHAFGWDQNRWHCRCWCHRSGCFKDFLLSRMLEIKSEKEHLIDNLKDIQWHTLVDVKIGANPKLTIKQQKVIERDYGMSNGVMAISIRLALLYYFLQQYRLDREENEPEKQQIVLLNRDEIEEVQSRTLLEEQHYGDS